jgi:hypothetical protein
MSEENRDQGPLLVVVGVSTDVFSSAEEITR